MSPVLDLNQTHLYQAFSVLLVDDEVGVLGIFPSKKT